CAALYPRAGEVHTVHSGDTVSFCLDSLRTSNSSASSLCDITGLFAFYQLFQWLVGVDLHLRQVRIGPIDRENTLPFLKLFGAPVLAGGQAYALEFPQAVLDLPVVRTSTEFEHFFELYPCGVFQDAVNDLGEQVAFLLSAAVRQGEGLPRQEDVARSLGLPLSTLRRQLSLAGTGFAELRESCLRERAEALLRRSEYSIAEIASQLGYSDAAAFRRAFRHWYDCSPRSWRRRQSTG
ncbi:MAG: helix-turn-helix transcriptional regulator, partial [Halioglobus sp.]